MLKSKKEKSNNGQQGTNNKGTNNRIGTEDERVRNIRRLYTTDDENIQPYTLRSYGRGSSRVVINTFKNGEKYIDNKGNITYYKNGLTVHTNKTTGNIITVIYRGSKSKLPKTWREYNE